MKALFTDEQLKSRTKFKGNVNGAVMEILKDDKLAKEEIESFFDYLMSLEVKK